MTTRWLRTPMPMHCRDLVAARCPSHRLLDEAGDIVLLPGQPRDRWDAWCDWAGPSAGRTRPALVASAAGIAAEHATAADHAH
jgi:hypothetical protein